MIDLRLDINGDLKDGHWEDDDAVSTSQRVDIAISRIEGEWKFDETDGIPILDHKRSAYELAARASEQAGRVSGVSSFRVLSVDTRDRVATITAEVNGRRFQSGFNR